MKTLWNPWRMEHVTGQTPPLKGCLFEPEGSAPQDIKTLLLYRDADVIVLLNKYPYANGHLLVAPTRHVSCITMLSAQENNELMQMIQSCAAIIKENLNPAGLNIGCNIGACAGAGIADHLHFHIIPRWEGDHNFMTTLAEVRSIPQHIDATFNLLSPYFTNLISDKK